MIDPEVQAKLDRLEQIEAKNRARAKRYLDKVKTDGRKQLSAIISGEAYETLCRIRDKAIQNGKPESFGQIIENALAFYTSGARDMMLINDVARYDNTGDKCDVVQDILKDVNINDNTIKQNQTAEPVAGVEALNNQEPVKDNDGDVLDLEIELDTEATDDQEKDLVPEIDLGDFEDNDSVDQEPEPVEEPVKPIRETQTEIPGPEPDKARIIERIAEYRAAGDSWPAVADKLNTQGILTARGEAWTKANAQAFYSRNKKS